jgi:holin-like protein
MNLYLLLKKAAKIAIQITFLWGIYYVSTWITGILDLPIPGGVVGMIVLFTLLITGILPLRIIDDGVSLLLGNFPLLFIPLAVGLMPLGSLFMSNWLTMLVTVFVSTGMGIIVTGMVSQLLAKHGKNRLVNENEQSN